MLHCVTGQAILGISRIMPPSFRAKLHDPANTAMILPSTRIYSSSDAMAHSVRPESAATLL
jgi:hypothetical protein